MASRQSWLIALGLSGQCKRGAVGFVGVAVGNVFDFLNGRDCVDLVRGVDGCDGRFGFCAKEEWWTL